MGVVEKAIRHLFPRSIYWARPEGSEIASITNAFSVIFDLLREDALAAYDDLYPQSTRMLDEFSALFGLSSTGTEQERRDRLQAAWREKRNLSHQRIEDVLRAQGFDVYVHEPLLSTGPNVFVAPLDYLNDGLNPATVLPQHGRVDETEHGDPSATHGFVDESTGIPIVNVQFTATSPGVYERKKYVVPSGPTTTDPFFLYICGEVFPEPAIVPQNRRAEFEALVVKITPAHFWVGFIGSFA